jgi:hypothetical protein
VAVTLLISCLLAVPTRASTQNRCDELQEQWRHQPEPKNWNSLYRLFKRFGQCNDGEIADGTSFYVGQLFLKQWAHLDVLNRLTVSDKSFGDFVLRHLDATISEGELKAILDLSKWHCPGGQEKLCRLVAIRVDSGLNDLRK